MEKEKKNLWKELNNRANKNFKKRVVLIAIIFFIFMFLGSSALIVKTKCVAFNDQSNYFTANVFFVDGMRPVCMKLTDYDEEYLDNKLYECLNDRQDFDDPFKCKEKPKFPTWEEYEKWKTK